MVEDTSCGPNDVACCCCISAGSEIRQCWGLTEATPIILVVVELVVSIGRSFFFEIVALRGVADDGEATVDEEVGSCKFTIM